MLALGEISPEFEDKQVIVAERVDRQPFGRRSRGEKRAGCSARDLVRIRVVEPR